MSDYTEFFLSGNRKAVQLELLEISHPNFSETFRMVRNARQGVTVTINSSPVFFRFLPMTIKNLGTRDDLDAGIQVVFGDSGKILSKQYDRIRLNDGFDIKPTVLYYVFSSEDLTKPLFGPLELEVRSFTYKREAVTFEARAPQLNYSATGMLYKLDRFPMLRGAL